MPEATESPERRAYQSEIRDRIGHVEARATAIERAMNTRYDELRDLGRRNETRLDALEAAQAIIQANQDEILITVGQIRADVSTLRNVAERWRDARVIFRVTYAGGRVAVWLATAVAAGAAARARFFSARNTYEVA